jgi:hypothetical protein
MLLSLHFLCANADTCGTPKVDNSNLPVILSFSIGSMVNHDEGRYDWVLAESDNSTT